jgi:hypothetical protein
MTPSKPNSSPMGEVERVARALFDDNGIDPERWNEEKLIWLSNARAAIQALSSKNELPSDVRRLVIAARNVAFSDCSGEELTELDAASEAFADRVPWDDEPDEFDAALNPKDTSNADR